MKWGDTLDFFAVYEMRYGFISILYNQDKIEAIKWSGEKPCHMGYPTLLTDDAAMQLSEYFEGKRKQFDFPYHLKGTEFQKKVWAELCKIPYGETRSYKDIAIAIGRPKAYRAVGMANHYNPMMIVVPCHRVIDSRGGLGGYAGGLTLKKALLDLETKHISL